MRITLLAIIGCLLISSVAYSQRGRGRGRRAHEPVELKHFSYKLETFEAPSLQESQGEYGVYLPADYEQNESTYPLILWLHGMNEDASRFHNGGGAKVLEKLRADGQIPNLILVAPSAPSRTIYANGEGSGDVEKYILEDLLKHIDKSYRVSDKREERTIMGVSMGGMGALRMALEDPNRFGAVAVHSAAAFPSDPSKLSGKSAERVKGMIGWMGLNELLGDPVDPEKWAQYIPAAMALKLKPADLHSLRIYFDAGTDDRYGFGPPNEEFHQILDDQGIEHEFTMVQGGGHSWGSGSLQTRLEHSLKFAVNGSKPQPAEETEESEEGSR